MKSFMKNGFVGKNGNMIQKLEFCPFVYAQGTTLSSALSVVEAPSPSSTLRGLPYPVR
jgi:hypothetical protein